MDGCRLSLLENAPKQIFSRKEPFIEGRAFTGNGGWPQSSPPHNRKNILHIQMITKQKNIRIWISFVSEEQVCITLT